MDEHKAPSPPIERAESGGWGRDWSAPVDEGWGLRGTNSPARPIKAKGLWAYAQRTFSWNVPFVKPPKAEVRSLAVLAAEEVATHLPKRKL